jgi:hypothetical protein
MKKALTLTVAFVIVGGLLAGCGANPPLKSEKYLNDTSLIGEGPCTAPCFHDITVGQTNYTDAVAKLKADAAFANMQLQDKPAAASWSAKDGEPCCQMSANDSGVVNALLVKVAPNLTAQQVIDKYGQPTYVNSVDYSDKEVAIAMIFPEKGLVTWVAPGDANSTISANSPVVMALLLDPKEWQTVLDTATFQAWNGFLPYQTYKNATPVVTPRVTPTPQ